jgi:hypothetical protein
MASDALLRAHVFWVFPATNPAYPTSRTLSEPLSAGSIPGPIAFGWVIDKACLLWQDQCGQQGSCFVYQNTAMSQYMLTAGLIYKVRQSMASSPAPQGCRMLHASDRSTGMHRRFGLQGEILLPILVRV